MKQLLTAVLLLGAATLAQVNAQILKPVKWSYAAKKTSPTEAVIYLKATIEPAWHVYSQTVGEGGPVPTTFKFTPAAAFSLSGKTTEPKPISKFEKTFDMQVGYFENSVIFQQKIKLNGKTPLTVKGSLEYMTCNDQQCLPPETVAFSVPVN